MVFIKGFCDTMYLFKLLLPDRKKKKQTFSQGGLVSEYLNKEDISIAHNALNDVLMLQKLVEKLLKTRKTIIDCTRSVEFLIGTKERDKKTKDVKKSLSELKISDHMKGRLSKAGITKIILEKACETGGIEGLTILLSENVGGKPRITNNKKVIKTLFDQIIK